MKVDCHIHSLLDGEDWRSAIARHREKPDVACLRRILSRYQALGYTYLRDGGDRWGVSKAARDLAPEYGITYRTPLTPLYKTGHYGGFIGQQYENMREFAALVQKNRRCGGDFLKVMISGLMDFDCYGHLTEEGMAPDEIRELAHIATEEGGSVMAHCNGARTMEAAAQAGIASIEHGAYADGNALAAMVEYGTVWVPTLSAVGNLRGKGRFREAAVEAIFDSTTQNLRIFAQMGGFIAPGSDAGAWAVPHGAETEYLLLQKALGAEADGVLDRGIAALRVRF